MSHTYVLTAENGVPVFIYWGSGKISRMRIYFLKILIEGPNDSMKPVTNYMSIAPAEERKNDILFLGGQKVKRIFITMYECI